MYKVRDVNFAYSMGKLNCQALSSVSSDISRGEFVCLAGPSGSGKSTLLALLGLIEPIQQGSITFDGKELGQLHEAERNRIRRFEIGFVFQNFHLLQVLNAEENVQYFLSRQGLAADVRKERTRWALDAVGLWEHRRKKPLEMSGGQRQRVAIARALAKEPKVIIADEPTASLDSSTGKEIVLLMQRLCKERQTTIVTATHDPMVLGFAERQIRLVDGRIDNTHAAI
jgi:ABC-type lipoprotein export system ATPase subunit